MHVFTHIRDLITPYIITSSLTPNPSALGLTDIRRSIDVIVKRRGGSHPLSKSELQFLSEIAQNVAFHESLLLRGICHATEDGETCTKCKDGDERTCPVVQNFRRMIPSLLLGECDDWHLVQIAARPHSLSFFFESPKNYSTVTFDLISSGCEGFIFEASVDPYGTYPTIIRKSIAFLRQLGCLQRLPGYRLCFQDGGVNVTERQQDAFHQWQIINHPDFDPRQTPQRLQRAAVDGAPRPLSGLHHYGRMSLTKRPRFIRGCFYAIIFLSNWRFYERDPNYCQKSFEF